jgi:hypothetical protein
MRKSRVITETNRVFRFTNVSKLPVAIVRREYSGKIFLR